MMSDAWNIPEAQSMSIESMRQAFAAIRSRLERLPLAPLPIALLPDPRLQVLKQVDGIASLASAKLMALCAMMDHALATRNWLGYCMAGRSLIEHAATLRYYLWEKVQSLTEQRTEEGRITPEHVTEIRQILFQCIRGGRFNWADVLEQWSEVRDLAPQGDQPLPSQVNILTCIQKWAKTEPKIDQLYGMYCDLVHPNLGGSLLVIGLHQGEISFGAGASHPMGEVIVRGSGAALVGIAGMFEAAIVSLREGLAEWKRHLDQRDPSA